MECARRLVACTESERQSPIPQGSTPKGIKGGTTALYWRAMAAQGGVGRPSRATKEQQREAAQQRRLALSARGRYVLDGSGGGSYVPWWPEEHAKQLLLTEASKKDRAESAAALRINASVRLAERREAHAKLQSKLMKPSMSVSTYARSAVPRAEKAQHRQTRVVDLIESIGLRPRTPQPSDPSVLRAGWTSTEISIPRPGLGLPRECDGTQLRPAERARRDAGCAWGADDFAEGDGKEDNEELGRRSRRALSLSRSRPRSGAGSEGRLITARQSEKQRSTAFV